MLNLLKWRQTIEQLSSMQAMCLRRHHLATDSEAYTGQGKDHTTARYNQIISALTSGKYMMLNALHIPVKTLVPC